MNYYLCMIVVHINRYEKYIPVTRSTLEGGHKLPSSAALARIALYSFLFCK